MQQGKDSCRIFSRGLMESHLDPRMSTITVKPRLQTSSLEKKKTHVPATQLLPHFLGGVPLGEGDSACLLLMSVGHCQVGNGREGVVPHPWLHSLAACQHCGGQGGARGDIGRQFRKSSNLTCRTKLFLTLPCHERIARAIRAPKNNDDLK